jgi:hypothetical protein
MAWVYLFVAGIFETAWAIGLKYSAGFTKLGASIFTVLAMAISLYLLALLCEHSPWGPAMRFGPVSAPSGRPSLAYSSSMNLVTLREFCASSSSLQASSGSSLPQRNKRRPFKALKRFNSLKPLG